MQVWSAVVDKCELYLSSIVTHRESKYHQTADDEWGQDIDLTDDIDMGKITIFAVSEEDVLAFKSQFEPDYFADLDDGEAESLAYLVSQREAFLISSGDAIVYKVLGNLNRGEQGISLEELLQKCGLGRKIEAYQYGKSFREQLTRIGTNDMIQGRGRKQ